MLIHELNACYERVREGLGVQRGESIRDAAQRVIASGEMGRKRLCAVVILSAKRSPWEAMRVAAKVLDWGGAKDLKETSGT